MGTTPLYIACQALPHRGRREAARCERRRGATPLTRPHTEVVNGGHAGYAIACHGHLGIVQLLSSYGASRTFPFAAPDDTAEHFATHRGHHDIAAWLVRSRLWSRRSTTSRSSRPSARSRCCAPAPTSTPPPSPAASTPARPRAELGSTAAAAAGSAAHVVLEWGAPWSRTTHKFYPPQVRERVAELMRVAQAIKRGKAAAPGEVPGLSEHRRGSSTRTTTTTTTTTQFITQRSAAC